MSTTIFTSFIEGLTKALDRQEAQPSGGHEGTKTFMSRRTTRPVTRDETACQQSEGLAEQALFYVFFS
ncbi:hypothetical protein PNH38_15290 [Anoxybacillus rupiensis]|uniref:Uncharacterized protein n=1 Tax=Anoxybacteroides rupiense TaxID=311460 RepID=A0ABT5W7C3_9BACL|nr:hypothetical protein [Anoxybacillus rupiensis]